MLAELGRCLLLAMMRRRLLLLFNLLLELVSPFNSLKRRVGGGIGMPSQPIPSAAADEQKV